MKGLALFHVCQQSWLQCPTNTQQKANDNTKKDAKRNRRFIFGEIFDNLAVPTIDFFFF